MRVLALVATGARSSEAAFPGKNGLIAFQSFRDGYAQIYVMTDNPLQPKLVKRQKACYALPAWSRDGKKIAFEYNPDTAGRPARRSEIYLMNADGTGLKRLTRNASERCSVAWITARSSRLRKRSKACAR